MKNQSLYTVLQDHTCAICLTAFLYPVKINKCRHIFCGPCLEDSSELSGKRKCPLCRVTYTPQQIQKAEELQQQIQKLYPQIIQDKKRRIKNKKVIYLSIGNKTVQIADNQQNGNKYEWTLFVKTGQGQKPLKQYADKVELQLHPTFRPNKVIYQMNRFPEVEMKRIGWGTFRIGVKIYWKNKYQQQYSQVHHDLNFIPLAVNNVVCHLHEKLYS